MKMITVRVPTFETDKDLLEEAIENMENGSYIDSGGMSYNYFRIYHSTRRWCEESKIGDELNTYISSCNYMISTMKLNERLALGNTIDKYISTLQQYGSKFGLDFEEMKYHFQ